MNTRITNAFFVCLMIGIIFSQRPLNATQNSEDNNLRTIPNWSVNPADFEFNGAVIATVSMNGILVGSDTDMIAAFVAGEVRGVVDGMYFPVTGHYLFMSTIFSNNAFGEIITFKYYDASTDIIYDIIETQLFTSDMSVGTPMDPHPFNLEAPSIEITSITIENVNNISLGDNAYENQTINIILSISNPEINPSNQLNVGIIYDWFFGAPPSTGTSYDIIQSIPSINQNSTITLIIPIEFSVTEDNYGQKLVSARIDPNGVGGDFYAGVNYNSSIGWVQNSIIDNYDWPIPSGNMKRVTSVPNEFRESNGARIHQGVDLTAPGGSNILAVSSGKIIDVQTSNTDHTNFVTLENFDSNAGKGLRYYHLIEILTKPLNINDWIYSTGEILGEVYDAAGWGPHIHLDDFTKFGISFYNGPYNYSVNPFRIDGLEGPWIDNPDQYLPIIGSELLVLKDGINPVIVQGNVFGYQEAVDFVISAKDIGPNGGRMGLSRISFRILDMGGIQVFPDPALNVWETRVELQTTLNDANYYQMISPNATPYIYCYTECNDPGGDAYVDGSASNENNQLVRYFITNNITNPQSGAFSGHFKASDHGISTFNDYELIVRVEDYSNNPQTESFIFHINENGIIPGDK